MDFLSAICAASDKLIAVKNYPYNIQYIENPSEQVQIAAVKKTESEKYNSLKRAMSSASLKYINFLSSHAVKPRPLGRGSLVYCRFM
jgi:hypothetical protein